jgi:hypothetical protein
VRADAEVRPESERDVPVLSPRDVERVGIVEDPRIAGLVAAHGAWGEPAHDEAALRLVRRVVQVDHRAVVAEIDVRARAVEGRVPAAPGP